MRKILAILTSDWHLSLKPPIARSIESDWLETQAKSLKAIKELQTKYNVPVIIAGDITHHWDEKAELVNWIIKNAGKNWWAIRGQHDTPYHQSRDIHKSVYQTLIHSKVLNPILSPSRPIKFMADFYGFGWEEPFIRPHYTERLNVAIVHRYVWIKNKSFPGAPNKNLAHTLMSELKDYQVIVTGDNHLPFDVKTDKQILFNCGSLIPRNIDQKEYIPSVGLLQEDGDIKREYLNIPGKWLNSKRIKTESKKDLSGLLRELKKIDVKAMNFTDILEQRIKGSKISKDARKTLLEILEEVK